MKRWISFLLILTVLILPACKKVSTEWSEQYELGTKYLSDGNYQEAILSFSAAIDVDPNLPDAYIGRADAYIGTAAQLADGGITPGTEQSQQIIVCLQNAQTDYRTAKELIADGHESSEEPDVLQAKLEQTTERLNQVEEAEEQAAEADQFDEAYMAETQALTDDVMSLLDYAILLSALEESGAADLQWILNDDDLDGRSELHINTVASPASYRSTQLFADGDLSYLEAFTHTGAAGGSAFTGISLDTGFHILWNSGYYTVGYTTSHYRLWNGSGWDDFAHLESMPAFDDEGNVTGNDGYAFWNGLDISPDEFYAVESSAVTPLTYDNPDLSTGWVAREWRYVLPAVEAWLAARGHNFTVCTADLNGDGLEEQVYLVQNAADLWFRSLTYDLLWEDECFLGYQDSRTTAIVASMDGTQICLRMARLGSWSGSNPTVTATGLILDGTEYTYHSTGAAFTAGSSGSAPADGTVLTLGYLNITVPDSWQDQYVIIPVAVDSWGFCSKADYEQNGGGHVFTLCLFGTDYDYSYLPDYQVLGSLTAENPVTGMMENLVAVAYFPTDVQFTEQNAEQYFLLNSDVPAVLASVEAVDGVSWHPAS